MQGPCPEERRAGSAEDEQDLVSEGRTQADACTLEVHMGDPLAGLKRPVLLPE